MNYERYDIRVGVLGFEYSFLSHGPRGKILKLVRFEKTNEENVYNLAFGDYDPDMDSLDDSIISNNEDRDKVLATVAAAVYLFTEEARDTIVVFKGSTPSRTRLYRMAISKNIETLSHDFEINTITPKGIEPFGSDTKVYAFFVRRRNSYLY